ncbi:uncharacterized protein C5L36_0B00120 [Pichia kudriavzevii]|uniref:EKC/KEOPS complex subunit PCC1 n=1 Tax=Pichia kudriavzevii TaxID=4909 RepID=A0A2U9R0D8_PICKU|nr:uncharacterized protein C5L36_0B00120 [Pichia kudriavzevii]AWU74745.1 hypothetical protein C5L36_0B00120 [Pichia kudriavzevii]
MPFPVSVQVNIPFGSIEQARIARDALRPDPVLKSDQSSLEYSVQDSQLNISVRGVDDRIVRVSVNNVLENLKTIIECFEVFSQSG